MSGEDPEQLYDKLYNFAQRLNRRFPIWWYTVVSCGILCPILGYHSNNITTQDRYQLLFE